MDTIFAEATAPGKAGVAVIRVSGPRAFAACERLAGSVPSIRKAALRVLRNDKGEVLDRALVLGFARGGSFTGEDVVEFQLHGSRAVVEAVRLELAKIEGLRPAQPGEFTRRALDNDQLDLAQVEGLADLIHAETELQMRQANRVLSGELSDTVLAWRNDLIHAAALLEASLDFADEEVPTDVLPDVLSLLGKTRVSLKKEVDGFAVSDRIRTGFEVAILGPPNAGKSTLLNAIARRDVALTSDIAGTTRDIIEVRTDLEGLPVTFLDTAGIREAADELERAGIERAISRARHADLRILLSFDKDQSVEFEDPSDIVVRGKSDLGTGDISGLTGEGVDELLSRIRSELGERISSPSLATRERHVQAMREANTFISTAESCIQSSVDSELVALEVRSAITALEAVVGRIEVDDLLGDIFSRFCIGK